MHNVPVNIEQLNYTSFHFTDGIYFMLRETVYLHGSTVLITDIGTQGGTDPDQTGGALVCVTTNINTQCCRGSDHSGSGPVGYWYFPDGSQVPRGNNAGPFFRTGSTQQVRLGRMSGVMAPLGAYECRVPDSNGVEQVAAINIQLSKCFLEMYESTCYYSVTLSSFYY